MSDVVGFGRPYAVRAEIVAGIYAAPWDSTGKLGEAGQLCSKDLAEQELGLEIAHERADHRQTGVRPVPKWCRPCVLSTAPSRHEGPQSDLRRHSLNGNVRRAEFLRDGG